MAKWSETFTPIERAASSDIVPATNSAEWVVMAMAGIMAVVLFLHAGWRLRQGNTSGAIFSIVGGCLCALAPTLAKKFLF